jgi:ATP-binding cassette subfamily B protein
VKERTYTDFQLLRRLIRESRRYLPHIIAVFLLSLVYTPLALLGPVPLAIAVDSVIGNHGLPGIVDALLPSWMTGSDTAILVTAASMFVLIAFIEQILNMVSTLLTTYTGEKLLIDIRSKLFRHVQRLSLGFHDKQGTSDSTYRIQYDAYAIQQVTMNALIPLVTALVTFIAMVYVTARLDWQLALVALAVSPLLIFLSQLYRWRLRAQSREVKQLESGGLGVIQEVLTGMRVVKAFGQEEREQDRFVRVSQMGMRARIKLALGSASYGSLIALTTAAGTGLVLYVGVTHVQSGALTLGELLLIMTYLSGLYKPLKTVAKKAGSLQSQLASAERVFSLLDEEPEVDEKPDARPLERARGAVAFRAVSFSYEEGRNVLDGVSFEVEPGQSVGIAGPTGAGKTTLVSLLNRFYDPKEGAVLIDGVDLRDYRLADLRNQFGIVLQEPVLFSTSIAENIAYARPDASIEEIQAAADAANVHEFIAELPEAYETEVGERGMRLSGGERQRISLARAFLKDAPILILDEPTSSVDMRTEAGIMDAMYRLMEGRTTFMIAHRLSTLARCDIRLELEHGRLIAADQVDREMVSA